MLGALLGSGCVRPSCGGSGGAASRFALGEGEAAVSQAVPPVPESGGLHPHRGPHASCVFAPVSAEESPPLSPQVLAARASVGGGREGGEGLPTAVPQRPTPLILMGGEEGLVLAALQTGPQRRQGSVPSADMLGLHAEASASVGWMPDLGRPHHPEFGVSILGAPLFPLLSAVCQGMRLCGLTSLRTFVCSPLNRVVGFPSTLHPLSRLDSAPV